MTRSLRSIPAVLLLLGSVLSGQSAAPPSQQQQPSPPQPPVSFKLEVNYVEVDAIVTDQQGTFVRDLTKNDFEILEDGKVQTVSAFSLVNIPVERREKALFEAAAVEPDVQSNERDFDGRVYVIVLDDLHTSPLRTQLVKSAARRFIEQNFGANDVAAVMHTSGRTDASQEFTSNPRLLLAAVDKFMGKKLRSPTLDRIEQYRRQVDTRREGEPAPDHVDDPQEMQRAYQARDMLTTVKNIAQLMTGIRGRRKAMLLISEGVDYDIYQPFSTNALMGYVRSNESAVVIDSTRDAVAAATRANMAIYSVDPRGLSGFGDEIIEMQAPADNPGMDLGPNTLLADLRLSQDSLRLLSEQTGGEAFVNSNDFAKVFDRVVTDNSSYYVMGYYPTNDKRDGRFRKIEVKAKRPGLQVRARKGYFGAARNTPKLQLTDTGRDTAPELREALTNPLPMTGLTMTSAAAAFKGEAPNASVSVTVQVKGDSLKFAERDGMFNDKLDISIIALDQQGKMRGGDQTSLDLKVKPETYKRIAEGGIRVLSRVALPPGRYQIRVAGHETGAERVGSVYYDLQVPDFSEGRIAMSGLIVASPAETQKTITARPDEQLRDILPGPPTTDREFAAGEEIALFVDVYDNVTTPHKVDIQTTIRSEDGKVAFTNEEARESAELQGKRGGYGYTMQVPLSGLTPGHYILKVQATSRLDKAATVFREVPIAIRPAAGGGRSSR